MVQVVKYYPPSERISGVIGFLTALNRHLGDHVDLTVITSAVDGAPTKESAGSHEIQRVPRPFPVSAAVVLARHNPDIVIYVSSIFERQVAAPYFGGSLAASRLLGWKGEAVYFQATHLSDKKSRMFGRLLRRMDQVWYASPDAPADFRSFGASFFELLPAVDLTSLRAFPKTSARRRIGFINHLNAVKGFDRAVVMFQRVADALPECEFVIAGTGDLEHMVPAQIGRSTVARYGWLSPPDRVRLMASCDALVFPFRTGVSVLGLSQTVLESMALGVVPVGTKTHSVEPIISDSVDGIIYEDENDAIGRLVDLLGDTTRLRLMAEAARAKIANHFDASLRAKELADRFV